MTVIGMLLLVVGVVVVGLVCAWVIRTFFPAPAQTVCMCVVGVLLLLILLYAFFPGVGSTRIW